MEETMNEIQECRQDLSDLRADTVHILRETATDVQELRDEIEESTKLFNQGIDDLVLRTAKASLPITKQDHCLYTVPTGSSRDVTLVELKH